MNLALPLAAICCAFLPFSSYAQEPTKTTTQKPKLQLRIILDKETYALNERLVTQIEFVNLTDKTLCFPEPPQDASSSNDGSIERIGKSPKGREDAFIEHFDSRWPSNDKLFESMQNLWIKLGPNQKFVTKSAPVLFRLDSPGDWELSATYHPPEAAFGSAESRIQMRTLGKKIGCVPPEDDVSAPVVKFQVVPAVP